ncbi:MAG: hypothetical protein NT099_03625, partial [Candidatus Saganbacteria bacterium]|nr:hypothetical protein [Candidatus Saganbacteria bacterium]
EEILDTTKKEARSLQGKMLEQAKKESALIVQHANQEIDHQKNKAIEEIRTKTADLVIAATGKMLEKELNPQEHARLIEESLKEVEGNQ